MINQRINKLRKEITKQKLDALLVSDLINIKYLTGFSGTYAFLLVSKQGAFLFTDSRYYERCKKESNPAPARRGWTRGVQIRLIKGDWLQKIKTKRLGFEACSVNYNTYQMWRKKHRKIKFVPTRLLVEKIRIIKEPGEIKLIKKSIKVTENALNKAKKYLKVGISEIELGEKIENWMRTPQNSAPSFSPIIAFGTNASMPHAGLTKRKLSNHSLILIDLGASLNGYSSDLTRTFCIGRITKQFSNIYNIVLEAQRRAIEKVKPEITGSEVDAAARNYIKKQGFGKYFGHAVGHGVGSTVHEIPGIGPKNKHKLQPGMVFTIEPGIYIPGWGGVRTEDMVLVTDKGCKVLTSYPKELDHITI